MGWYDDLIGDKVKWVATQAAHKAEVESLKAEISSKNATIEMKDASIQTQEKQMLLMKTEAEAAAFIGKTIEGSVKQLSETIPRIGTLISKDEPEALELINHSSLTATTAASDSVELLGRLLTIKEAAMPPLSVGLEVDEDGNLKRLRPKKGFMD